MKTVMNKKNIALLVLASTAWGCSFHARSPEDYQKETTKLLASKSDELKACYDEVLREDSKASGVVAVDFTVEAKTGAIMNPKLDAEKTTANEQLGECVLSAMQGLVLDPPDQRSGVASFSYEFVPNEPKQL